MTTYRYQFELDLLKQLLPLDRFKFSNGADSQELLLVTEPAPGKWYVLKFYLENFPDSLLDVTVHHPKPLKMKDGTLMTNASLAMHCLGERDGCTKLCLYKDWDVKFTLVQVFLRSALWLQAYEWHLETGNNLDYYLSHA